MRSGGSLGSYSVTAKIRTADGALLATSQFSAEIPNGQFGDSVIRDGVDFLIVAPPGAIEGGRVL